MKPLRVLIMVGDPERRTQLVTLLRGADHHVATATDVASAAASITQPGFDTLILDLAASDLDLSALRHVIAHGETGEPESLDTAERWHLAKVLNYTGGNKRKAAHLLGISRSTLLNKVRKYGLEGR